MILKGLKDSILSIGKSIEGPIFIKNFTDENPIVLELEQLKETNKGKENLRKIERDINFLKAGHIGEKNVYYELKNSFLPMVCLHDLYIKYKGYEAQIDFVIITNKFICILETKKLNGDIYVNNKGDFIRRIKNSKGKVVKKEGIYSPITQNERHISIVKELLKKYKLINRCPIFSRVVMANPKSVISTRYAPKNIKEKLIKHDQINESLRKLLKDTDIVNMSYQSIMDIGNFLRAQHIEKREHYIVSKYKDPDDRYNSKEIIKEETSHYNKEELVNKLKKFRVERSRQEKIKPYFIFNNKQMEDLISEMPKNKEELIKVSGFGKIKAEKYGNDIINIVKTYE
ncbi:NERD domain-containing protein [Dethiothermospora halolimnae]|uniref:NERD domain-containing protein n=1 Tax=Dethiothermospora halolimnae TaxID=3114390 RepID=UPI003CCBB74E